MENTKFKIPKFIKRTEWGATPLPYNKPYFPQIPTKIIFHHYGFKANNPNIHMMPLFKGGKSIRYIQRKAINQEGLIDIQYHYIIAPNGDIYLGRPPKYMGKHCKSNDNGSIGIMCFGNFNVEKPTNEMKISIVYLLRYLHNKFKSIIVPNNIFSHRDKTFTSCPGIHLYNFIERLKANCKF